MIVLTILITVIWLALLAMLSWQGTAYACPA